METVAAAYSAMAETYIELFDGDFEPHPEDSSIVARHLGALRGPVLDLGCGPGLWTARLHSLGADVTGVDLVPEFVAHARAHHPGPEFRLGSMLEPDAAERPVAGILAWYSTIHLPPAGMDRALGVFRRLLTAGGVLVLGFFDSDDDVAEFDHAVVTAWRWPVDALVARLAAAGFAEVERLQYSVPERPDRRYAAVAARAC